MIRAGKAAPDGARAPEQTGKFHVSLSDARGRICAMARSMGIAVFALSCLISPAWAQGVCVRPQDMTALQTATVQQHFMVAALSCGTADLYNDFVRAYRGDLQKSDEALEAYFLRRDAANGLADYHAFKTRLADEHSARSADNMRNFCRNATASIAIA